MKHFFAIAAISLFLAACSGVFFQPTKTRMGDPSVYGLRFEERMFNDNLGPSLIVWDLAPSAEYQGTVLFFHGNAQNISAHVRSVAWLPERGYRVVLFDYRGYGGSHGDVTLSGVHDDAQRMINYAALLEPDACRRVLFGQSLGASIALFSAAQKKNHQAFSSLIADSPFAGYRMIAREKVAAFWLLYPFQFPLGWLISDRFSPITVLKSIDIPVLYLHGENDEIVPPHHSLVLHSARPEGSERWTAPSFAHIEFLNTLRNRDRVIEWIDASRRRCYSRRG